MASQLAPTARMPVLFVGHGNPMNAIEENGFTRSFRELGARLPRPQAILCISAHWETRGTFLTAMERPPTIHDFGGFPRELYQVQYPAPGSPALVEEVQGLLQPTTEVGRTDQWGLDHGAWSVLTHFYPAADIPVVEMSIDATQGPRYHYELGRQLASLRHRGVLIIGSGNLVHNLRLVDWPRMHEVDHGFDWALEARARMNQWILEGNHRPLIDYRQQGRALQLAIPTPDHFLPLLYILGLQDTHDEVSLFNDQAVAGSLTMTSVCIQ